MKRPDFITAFLGLLGLFNLCALAFVLSGLSAKTAGDAGFYAGVAVGCFAVLLVRNLGRGDG